MKNTAISLLQGIAKRMEWIFWISQLLHGCFQFQGTGINKLGDQKPIRSNQTQNSRNPVVLSEVFLEITRTKTLCVGCDCDSFNYKTFKSMQLGEVEYTAHHLPSLHLSDFRMRGSMEREVTPNYYQLIIWSKLSVMLPLQVSGQRD